MQPKLTLEENDRRMTHFIWFCSLDVGESLHRCPHIYSRSPTVFTSGPLPFFLNLVTANSRAVIVRPTELRTSVVKAEEERSLLPAV